ncbi:MAG: glutamine synthetase family protein [Marinoscillum sp.]|uniref:glutamine synthetase family protein n=1 Tax=Marinoscillum sp. TaxID=2024838 RepID=UPI00330534D0
MNQKEILERIHQSEDNRVKVAITDIDGVLRGKIIRKEKLLSTLEQGTGFCDVVFGWDMVDAAYDNATVTGWHTGYPDATFHLDLATYRNIPWDEHIPFFLGDFSTANHPACPRSLLKRAIQKAEKAGYDTGFSQEFEWFNFQETSETLAAKKGQSPTPLTTGMFGYSILRASQQSPYFNDLFTLLDEFKVPLEGLHTETGPGVYEAAIEYSGALEAADRAVLFKSGVKEIAHRHDITASFMAKWNHDLPGCSGHIHQSLWKNGKNIFYDPKGVHQLSPLMESYMAGQLMALPHILPMYAPTINSYKRLVEGAWAPTTLTWGLDNRTTALRVINPSEKATRVELRVPGADANPYLAMAAALASGLYGIENNLKLTTRPTEGNGYQDLSNGRLPADLKEATLSMKSSDLAKELFGESFVDHFTKTREWECRQFAAKVTDWELKRYFEII